MDREEAKESRLPSQILEDTSATWLESSVRGAVVCALHIPAVAKVAHVVEALAKLGILVVDLFEESCNDEEDE